MTLPKNLTLDVTIEKSSWSKVLPEYDDIIMQCLDQVFDNVDEAKAIGAFSHMELSMVLCDDNLIRRLNNQYREQDKPTNVLSFQGLDDEEIQKYLRSNGSVPDFPYSLGDIFISYETMIKESKEASITLKDHFAHIVIHGVLHLLGYDHIDDHDAMIMENIETKLLKNLNIDDPYNA